MDRLVLLSLFGELRWAKGSAERIDFQDIIEQIRLLTFDFDNKF
jgi:hypothetical protein